MYYVLLILISISQNVFAKFECKTSYDKLGIPHVKTNSFNELYFCFGFHHGQDRAWQMDFFRRIAQGRNAEVLGPSHLKSDLMMRLLDISSEANRLWTELDEEKKKLLLIYSDGVNEGFKIGQKSREFKDLGHVPDPWTPQDSILLLLLQSFDQTRKTFYRDYEEEIQKQKWGEATEALFDSEDAPWSNTILKDGEYEKKEEIVKTTYNRGESFKLWSQFPSIFGVESGSNNWVVSKRKSKSGFAILANDPHLDLKTPIFWYWISLNSTDAKVIGGSIPGIPIIASGTNGKVAWGLTNSYLNSSDAVFLKDLKDEQVESFRPIVYVKFWKFKLPFFFKSFEKLKSGERILPLETKREEKLILNWTGFKLTGKEISPLFDVHLAKNVKEMDLHLSKIGLPSWNFVFADTEGDIGLRLVGKTFKHFQKTVFGVPTMTFKEVSNQEFLSVDERPYLINPKRNYIYTANNRHWPKDSKFYGGRAYSSSFRAFRIDELLQRDQDLKSFQQIQCDRQVVDARFFVPKLNKYLGESDKFVDNLIAEDSSLSLPIYRRFMDLLMEKWEVNEAALFKILDHLDSNKIDEFLKIFKLADTEINQRNWGSVLRLRFEHLSKNKEWKFSPDISGVGDSHSVDPGSATWNREKKIYEQQSGASMRMIIELQKTPKIWLALPGLNRNYDIRTGDAQWTDWKSCQYSEIKF